MRQKTDIKIFISARERERENFHEKFLKVDIKLLILFLMFKRNAHRENAEDL